MTFSHDLFKFSMTLGKVVTCENFENVSLFWGIFRRKRFKRDKLWCPPSLLYIAIAL